MQLDQRTQVQPLHRFLRRMSTTSADMYGYTYRMKVLGIILSIVFPSLLEHAIDALLLENFLQEALDGLIMGGGHVLPYLQALFILFEQRLALVCSGSPPKIF